MAPLPPGCDAYELEAHKERPIDLYPLNKICTEIPSQSGCKILGGTTNGLEYTVLFRIKGHLHPMKWLNHEC